MPDRDAHSNRPGPLQSLRPLTEAAQLETERGNEGSQSQSETTEAVRSRQANDPDVLDLAG
jgi:hypothetical protein